MATNASAGADTLQATRSPLRAAVEPRPALKPVLAGISLVDSVMFGPLAEPYLRPLVRRYYQALLLGSAAAGALVSHYPGRSFRTVLKVAGPLLLTSIASEIPKAGIRQMRGEPPPSPILSSD